MLIVVAVRKLYNINLFFWLTNKYYILPVGFFCTLWLYKIYTKQRVEEILNNFERKEKQEKIIWLILFPVIVILPIVLLALLLNANWGYTWHK